MSKKLLKSAAVVSSMTLISRILGLVRDIVLARYIGVNAGMDAFFIAFKIPNFMRRLFAEGAFSQAFVPVFSEYKTQRSHEEVRQLSQDVAGTLGGILFVVTLVGVIAAPVLVTIFAPGFYSKQDQFDLTVELLRFTFPYIFFISLTALAGGILNTYDRFAIPAFTPVLLNIVLILSAVYFSPQFSDPVMALAIGVFVAGLVQLMFQLPYLGQLKLLARPRWAWRSEGVKRIKILMLPALFGSSVAQINLLFDVLIASFLVTGSVSWLYFSDRLVEFPLGVFGIALATVILPNLSKSHAAASPEKFSGMLDWAMRWVLLIGTPATVGLAVLASPMLITLFQYGEFGGHDVHMASLSLVAYSLGLLGFILVKVLAPGFFARQDTKTPVKIAIIAMGANMVLNVIFVVPMVYLDIEGPHSGLAYATSLGAFINAGLLFRALRNQGIYKAEKGWAILLLRVVIANSLMGAMLLYFVDDVTLWMQWGMWERVWNLALWVTAAALLYFATLFMLGVKVKDLVKLSTRH